MKILKKLVKTLHELDRYLTGKGNGTKIDREEGKLVFCTKIIIFSLSLIGRRYNGPE